MEIALSTSPAHIMMTRKKNTWYSVRDGNWSDPNTWISNALDKKIITSPRAGDDVYILHNVVLDISVTVNNLYVQGKLTSINAILTLTVNGDLQASGSVDFTSSNTNLFLFGYNNFINSFTAGNSTVTYIRAGDQNVMDLSYLNLTIASSLGTKMAIADLTINGGLVIGGVFNGKLGKLELGPYNATFNTVSVTGILSKTGTGTVNFLGLLAIGGGSTGTITFTGNPTINMSGGLIGDMRGGVNLGNGTLNVLTTQTWNPTTAGNTVSSLGEMTILIASGQTLTLAAFTGTNSGGWINNGTINGVDGTSVFNNSGTYAYGNSNVAMATGVFNYNFSGTSNIQIQTGVTMNLPFTSFYDLTVNGSATLVGNTTVSHNLSIGTSLECSIYDFTCNGNISIGGTFSKTGSGTINIGSVSFGKISFTGNPTVNISGNLAGDARSGIDFGTGVVTVTQSISFGLWGAAFAPISIAANLIIASGKILTNIGNSPTSGGLTLTGTITGADSSAVFDNRSVLNYNNSTAPMVTGKLYCNQALNTFIYGLSGNQDIMTPSDATPGYQNLTLNGAGAKKLLGNVSVKGAYLLTSPATLNSNGFLLTNP